MSHNMSERVQTDVFLTHDWGKDELGRANHDRVALVNGALKELGYSTWFDSERMTGDIVGQMAAGIDNTRIVLVFVTQRYAGKVGGKDETDNCKLEFQYALRVKSKAFMISIVMEERMSHPFKWTGPVGFGLGGELAVRMFFDFSDGEKFTAAMAELKQEIDVRLMKLQASVPEKSSGTATTLTTSATTTAQVAHVPPRNTETSRNTTLPDWAEWWELRNGCNTLGDITSRVEDKRINSMFVVVDLLIYSYLFLNSPTTEEAEIFVNKLENINCQDNPLLKRISPEYIDSIISALMLSPRQEKVQFILLLEKIKNNVTLSSCHDNVILSYKTRNWDSSKTLYVHFEFKHPGTPECHMSGKCGFIIKEGPNLNWELCTQDTEYNDTGLHLHEIVSAEEMYYYKIVSGTTQEGNTVTRSDLMMRSWFPGVIVWEVVQRCVSYNVSSYLVAKQE